MPISRKPKQTLAGAEADAPVDIDALINRGGTVAVSEPSEAKAPLAPATVAVNLRIPTPMIERVDRALKTLPLKKPRHAWLLEAVLEKLERENSE